MIITPPHNAETSAAVALMNARNAVLATALADVPELQQLAKQYRSLIDGARSIETGDSLAKVTDDARAACAADGLPKDIVKRYAAALAARAAEDVTQQSLSTLAGQVRDDYAHELQRSLTAISEALSERLTSTLTNLRKQLPVAATAEDAIADGSIESWQKAQDLRAEYREIRLAQNVLFDAVATSEQRDPIHRAKVLVWYAADLAGVWPDLAAWHRYGFKEKPGGGTLMLSAPWPEPNTTAFIDWLAQHPEAKPWVPTPDQAVELIRTITVTRPITRNNDRRRPRPQPSQSHHPLGDPDAQAWRGIPRAVRRRPEGQGRDGAAPIRIPAR